VSGVSVWPCSQMLLQLTCKSSRPKAADIVQIPSLLLCLLLQPCRFDRWHVHLFQAALPMPVSPAPLLTYSYRLWLILQPSTSRLQLQLVADSAPAALLTYDCRSLVVLQPSTPHLHLQLVSGSAAKHPSPTTTAHCWFCSQALLTQTAHAICCTSCALQQEYVHLAGVVV